MGGEKAPLDVETSVRGQVEVNRRLTQARPGLAYIDYQGHIAALVSANPYPDLNSTTRLARC